MKKIKNLVNIMGVAILVAFIDGVFSLELSDNFYTFVGLVLMVCIIWLAIIVNRFKEDV